MSQVLVQVFLCGGVGYNVDQLFNGANQQNGATILYPNVHHSATTMSDAEWAIGICVCVCVLYLKCVCVCVCVY